MAPSARFELALNRFVAGHSHPLNYEGILALSGRLELPTHSLTGCRSTIELRKHMLASRTGLEPVT